MGVQNEKGTVLFALLVLFVLFGSPAICHVSNWSRLDRKVFNTFSLVFQAIIATLSWQSFLLLIYFFLQRVLKHLPRKPRIFITEFDNFVPFDPRWIIAYLPLGFIGGVLPVCMAESESEIFRFVRGFSTVATAQFICFIFFPTSVPSEFRNHSENEKKWKSDITFHAVTAMQKVDKENNAFPSGHCSLAAFTCLTLTHHLGWLSYVIMALIGLSCLFTKQHTIPDVFVGYILGAIIFMINDAM